MKIITAQMIRDIVAFEGGSLGLRKLVSYLNCTQDELMSAMKTGTDRGMFFIILTVEDDTVCTNWRADERLV